MSTSYNRLKELEDFDATKAGVKGLVDAGITKLPQMFLTPREDIAYDSDLSRFEVPMIDLKDVRLRQGGAGRHKIVENVKHACEEWGFFQVINHGILQDIMDEMIEGVGRFNEQPTELKEQFYSREMMKKVRFNSNFDLYKAKFTNWRDTLSCVMAPNPLRPEEYPEACRDIMFKYSNEVKKLGLLLFQLISEALDLEPNCLESMECADAHVFFFHYYPACPEPDQTLGHTKHTDPAFLTILLQDHIGGLQVLHEGHWIDVLPIRGSLVVNIGDLLQLLSNDKFKSVEHRVLANNDGPRKSAACLFTPHFQGTDKLYGPIKELLSDESPALYKETTVRNYIESFSAAGLGGISALAQLRLRRD